MTIERAIVIFILVVLLLFVVWFLFGRLGDGDASSLQQTVVDVKEVLRNV